MGTYELQLDGAIATSRDLRERLQAWSDVGEASVAATDRITRGSSPFRPGLNQVAAEHRRRRKTLADDDLRPKELVVQRPPRQRDDHRPGTPLHFFSKQSSGEKIANLAKQKSPKKSHSSTTNVAGAFRRPS
jgi:hypothetical protein